MSVPEQRNQTEAAEKPRTPGRETQPATQPDSAGKPPRKHPSKAMLNLMTWLVGLGILAIGLAYLIFNETPVFAIPLVVTVPVIAAVAFRDIWD